MFKKVKIPFGILVLLCLFVSIMIPLSIYDQLITQILLDHGKEWVVFWKFMDKSILEGEKFGGSDPGSFYILGTILLYLFLKVPSFKSKFGAYKPDTGFVLSSGLICAFGLVQGLKFLFSRARPYLIYEQGFNFTEWYEFGEYHFSELDYSGSFPSGHTVLVVIFLTISYILSGDPKHKRKSIWLGYLWGVLVIAFSVLMGISRAMANRHWITDTAAIILIVWFVQHLLYHYILQIPKQKLALVGKNSHKYDLNFWELKFSFRIVGVMWGVTLFGIGIRTFFFEISFWYHLCDFGLLLIFVSLRNFNQTLPKWS